MSFSAKLKPLVYLAGCCLLSLGFSAQAEEIEMQAAEQQSGPEYGRLLFGARCVICHQLPDPKMLSINQWRFIIGRMQKRMASKSIPELPPNEVEDILAWLREEIAKP